MVLVALLLAACGGGTPRDPGIDGEDDPGPADTPGETAADPVGDPGPGPCVDPDTLGEAVPPADIAITRVEANPGVATTLWRDGDAVPYPERNARLPRHRPTLVRVYLDTLPGWTAREIEGRLLVGDPACALVEAVTPVSPSTDADLPSTLVFTLSPEMVVPSATYAVELHDPSGAGGGRATRVPASGTLPLGVEEGPMHMRVVIVPVDYAAAGCTALADTSPVSLRRFHDAMFQQYPVESLEITVHAALPWTTPIDGTAGISDVLEAVMATRTADGADEDVYYYGLYDICGACIDVAGDGDCFRGLAVGEGGFLPPSGRTRNAVGQAGDQELWTFVHETGHMHGRGHVACPGPDPGGVDGSYPYPEGSTGTWGYGIADGALRDPSTHKDFMTICDEPTWVSDYQWEALFTRIADVNAL